MEKTAFETAFLESLKEGGRLAISLFIGYVLDATVAYFGHTQPSGSVMMGVGVIVRLIDNYWHQYNKEVNPQAAGQSQGIIPF